MDFKNPYPRGKHCGFDPHRADFFIFVSYFSNYQFAHGSCNKVINERVAELAYAEDGRLRGTK